MELDYKSIGDNIRLARERVGISQSELAIKIGGSTAAISMYESGERKVTLEVLNAISRHMGVSMKELLEGYEKQPIYISFRSGGDDDKLQAAIKRVLNSEDDNSK